MRRYVVVRTDKARAQFVLQELEQGRLRQGWGWKTDHDLRALRAKLNTGVKLADEERSVWRNRRLLDTEPDGVKPGDVAIIPNLPEQGHWVIAIVDGSYRFDMPAPAANVGTDYGHVVPVRPVRDQDGKLGVVEADSVYVHARLRASMRSKSRMWSVDALGPAVEDLICAIEAGKDTQRAQTDVEKFEDFFAAVKGAAWENIRSRYKGAEFEHLVHRVFERLYRGSRVDHRGGAGERGADLMVFMQDPLGLEYRIAVQVKLHEGEDDDTHSLDQIKRAREELNIHAGVVVTTAETTSEQFDKRREELEDRLKISIRVMTRNEFVRLALAHLGKETETD